MNPPVATSTPAAPPVVGRREPPRVVRPLVAPWGRRTLAVAIAALFVALGARFAVPLPGAAVPQSLQTFAVVVAGALLGPARGSLAVVIYLMLGVAGFPVFAGGAAGMAPLLGPGGGFLVSFVPAAMLAGAARGRRARVALTIFLAAHALVLTCGWARLASFLGPGEAWARGVDPFLWGAVVKSLVAAAVILVLARRDLFHVAGTPLAMELEPTLRDLTPRLLRYCAGRVGDPDLAADLAQDALVALVARWRVYGPPASPIAFVIAIARRRAFRVVLRRRLLQPLDSWLGGGREPLVEDSPERRAEHRQAVRRAAAAVRRLPAAERETLLLVVAAELTMEEAAAVLGVGVSAVKMRLSRARERMRRLCEATAPVEQRKQEST